MRNIPVTVGEYLKRLFEIEEAWLAQSDRIGEKKRVPIDEKANLRADIMREIDRYRRARTMLLNAGTDVRDETPLSAVPLHIRLNLPSLAIGDDKRGYTMQEVTG